MLSFHSNQTLTKSNPNLCLHPVSSVGVMTKLSFSIARHVWRCCHNEQYRQPAETLILSSCSSSSTVCTDEHQLVLDIIPPGFSLILLSLHDCSFSPAYTGHILGIECRTSQMLGRCSTTELRGTIGKIQKHQNGYGECSPLLNHVEKLPTCNPNITRALNMYVFYKYAFSF